ncbi:hybrid sensor histidine kinase/response regulator [Variovorax ginsengisoli]|uniref:histidine kinase n=1 Tax=Variovorax ginsengisoli TaxID=363844 RepID=A0ABT8SGG4_9BURK|nr:ATP-binding protein [Variovorax ginsengisoli]MDN8618836.1 ATP-binding protein [Variovorax ginsengisoli]MDO1538006.1 ATP-binding protein [Variovorax ginsengisoli]
MPPARSPVTGQKIFRIRRDYNAWVANETLEDYALRYTPRSFRKWSEFRVGNAAFGATSFLALEAIGGAIALSYGFENALWAILVVGIVTFLTGLPICYYAARYGVDMDLLTRGAGFGYLGSTLTSLIYASFTFIFFALEAAILALALQMFFDWPLWACYMVSSVVIIPLVMRGITMISALQLWSQPIWLLLFVCPFIAVLFKNPHAFSDFTGLVGRISGSNGFDPLMFGAAATVAFSLVVQIGEQVDYLRFLPEKTPASRVRWWTAVLVAGPGWIVPGMIKMLGGAFLAFLALQHEIKPEHAVEPTHMYLAGFAYVFENPAWVLGVTTLFVIVSQMKINLTNAYAGSLAWSNFFARLTHSHPGRVVWLVFNVLIAILLMTLGVFAALEKVLGLYSNIAIAWVGALVADLVINKPLGWSPRSIEFKRAHLYDINPVGLVSMLVAATLAMVAYAGVLGRWAESFSPFIALLTALLVSPLMAWRTRGRYYLARADVQRWMPGELVRCSVCDNSFESEDMAHCPAYAAPICSLCCTLESRCHDACKTDSRASEQIAVWLKALLPPPLALRLNFRVAHYLLVATSLIALLATVMGIVYAQEGLLNASATGIFLQTPFLKVFAMLSMVAAVAAWWIVLGSESRKMAQEESNRHNHLLTLEIEAHRRTDAALQSAKEAAESANQAKTRYVAGMTHELRTPLNSILGYSQILLKNDGSAAPPRAALHTIHKSGEHMLGLIDGLLDLARIEAGRLQLEPMPLALAGFLDEVVRMVRPQAEAKGLAFVYSEAGRLPAWVQADAKRLRQILINLLSNAVRFTDAGTVTLHVDARHQVLRFDVVDTGIGVAAQDHQRIFLPFERGAAGRRHGGEPGTGLGLTITGLLTSLMGGELRLSDTSAEGSTFSVRLYLREVADPGPQAEPRRAISGYFGPRRTLLVVDDQPVQRQMLAGMLMPLGFDVHEAASGTECLDSLRAHVPSAILLDLSMDDMDGWETAGRVRAAGFTLPIIIVSANVFENHGARLRASDCQAFVGKPVIESELIATLERNLGLEWLQHAPAPAAAAPALPELSSLPEDARLELMRLVQVGHVRGLQQALDRLAHDHPALAATCTHLRALVARFDFDSFKRTLAEEAHAPQT